MKRLALILAACCMLASCEGKEQATVPAEPHKTYIVNVYLQGVLVHTYETKDLQLIKGTGRWVVTKDGVYVVSAKMGAYDTASGIGYVCKPKQEGGSNE